MAFKSHSGTMGHKIGSAIIGKDNGKPAEPDGDEGAALTGFYHLPDIHIKGAANGLTVTHTPKPAGSANQSQAESAPQEQMHVFRDAQEAHNHIGQLLGVRMASGLQKT